MFPHRDSCPSLPLLALAATAALLVVSAPLVHGVIGPLPSMASFCSNNSSPCVSEPLRVGSWNLQRFGVAKVANLDVIAVIVQVIRTFDLIVLLEVTDSGGTAVPGLVAKLNAGQQLKDQYTALESPRIGRTTYKEQYVFVYKPSKVSYVSGYQYADTTDKFQVEPFVAKFSSVVTEALQQFTVIPLHAKPSDAVAELDALVDVYDDMVTRTGISDSIILGDFNAGCDYLVQTDYGKIRLHTQSRFRWLISDHADTTTKTTSCPYDRIVVAGPTVSAASYDATAAPQYFDEAMGIQANQTLVEGVSDHYPVSVLLRGTVPSAAAAAYPPASGKLRVSVGAELPVQACWAIVHTFVLGLQPASEACHTTPGNGPLVYAEWPVGSINAAGTKLLQLAQTNPQLVTDQAVAVLGYKAGHGALSDPALFGLNAEPEDVRLNLLCRDEAGAPKCSLTLSAATKIN